MKAMRNIYAQFNTVDSKSRYSPELRKQIFTQVWTSLTDMKEILKLRCDDEQFYEGENEKGEIVVEAFFTDEEALALLERFPSSFKVLVYA